MEEARLNPLEVVAFVEAETQPLTAAIVAVFCAIDRDRPLEAAVGFEAAVGKVQMVGLKGPASVGHAEGVDPVEGP